MTRLSYSAATLALACFAAFGTAQSAEIFSDNFDSPGLEAKWQIVRPNNGSMAVENGELLILSSKFQSIEKEENENILLPRVELPAGDWTLSLDFSGEFRTAREELLLGIMGGAKIGENDVWAAIGSRGDKYDGWAVYAAVGQQKKERQTHFTRFIWRMTCNVCPKDRMFPDFVKTIPQPIEAKFAKTGQQYVLSVKLGPERQWEVMERITAIGATGKPFILLRQWDKAEGETLVRIDSVKIEEHE